MGMTTLYGKTAVHFTDDRHTYVSLNGAIALPDHLVNKALSMGYTRHPLPSVVEDEPARVPTAPAPKSLPPVAPPAAACVISFDVLGRWSALADGPAEARSFRYAYDKQEAPQADLVAAVGIVHNEPTFLASSAEDEHLSAGESIHLTIVPFTGVDGSGQRLSPIVVSAPFGVPAAQRIELPGEHPQVGASAAAAARAHPLTEPA